MAEIRVDVSIHKPRNTVVYKARPVVDVWADHSVFPETVLSEIGIEPT